MAAANFGLLGRASVDVDVRLDRMEAQFKKGQQQVERSTRRMEQRVEGFEKRITRITGETVKWGAALIGITGAAGLGRLVTNLARTGDEIQKTADKIGIGTSQLQELRFAAERTGVATGTLDLSLQRFSRRVGEAANGSGELSKIVEETGLELRDASGNIRPLNEILLDYADIIAKTESPQEKLRLAFKAFDSEGAALVNTLNEGSEGLQAYADRANELGGILSQDAIQASVEFNDALTDLQTSATDLSNTLGPTVLTALTNLINFITNDAIPTFGDLLTSLDELAAKGIKALREEAQELEQSLTGGLTLPLPPKPDIDKTTESIKETTVAINGLNESLDFLKDAPASQRGIILDAVKSRLGARDAQELNALDDLIKKTEELEKEGEEALARAPRPPDITAGEARAAQEAEDLAPAFERAEKAARGFSAAFATAFEDAIFQADSLKGLVASLGEELARVALRAAVIEPLAGALGGALGSGIFGSGATATGARGAVLSTNLGPGVVTGPTITPLARGGALLGERGREAVIPFDRMAQGTLANLFDMGGESPEVQIIDQRGAQAPDIQQRTVNGPGGRERLQLIIRDTVGGMFADGSIDQQMAAFGNRRVGVGRG